MKDLYSKLNKAFESRVRLGIMSILCVNEWIDFNTLKELLEVTDGNLATHLRALEDQDMIRFRKDFVGRKPRTSYCVSEQGRKAFYDHIAAIESMVKK
jgi:DNA-binding HxlR family transcriptional regulator